MTSPPDGFVPYARSSPYLDLIGPLYESTTDPAVVRLQVDVRHTNTRGWLHAGVLVAVADVLMGHTAHRAGAPEVTLVTVSLTTDFPASAQSGDWVEGHAAVVRRGRQLAFTRCTFTANQRLVLSASGVFATVPGARP